MVSFQRRIHSPPSIFHKLNPISYEDSYVKFKGKLIRIGLFDINESDDIQKKIIQYNPF
jgi:hypothetical protein